MTVAWIIFGVAVVLAVLLPTTLHDSLGVSPLGFIGGAVCAIGAFCVATWMGSLHYDRATCHSWAHKTGRQTKFAYYNAFAWDCLVQAHDGKWVPKDQIGDYNK